jgi:hypothetical protein
MKTERTLHSPEALSLARRWAELDRKWLEEIQSEVHATDNPHLAPDYEPYSKAHKVYGPRSKTVIPALGLRPCQPTSHTIGERFANYLPPSKKEIRCTYLLCSALPLTIGLHSRSISADPRSQRN